jgi:hypothetical protein
MNRAYRLLANLTLSALALVACFVVLEYGVFAYVLVPDDVLRNVTINGVVRYQPDTRAVFHNPDGSRFLVTVNDQGWNSTKQKYTVRKTPGVLRIAVIGDSYVHAATVNVQDNFAEVLERQLNARGVPTEVYRFGMDGAPLSQYLHVLRREVVRYKPDIVLVQLIHNDFDERYRLLSTRDASSFLKVEPTATGCCTEVAPVDFTPGLADSLREFRTFRYLYYETGLYARMGALAHRFWWGGNERAESPEFISSAIDIRNIQDKATIRVVTRYLLEQMQAISRARNFKLVFSMDGVREAIYSGRPRSDYAVSSLNEIAAEITGELGLPFIDLQNVFAEDYQRNHTRLEYSWDWHWNKYANELVGETLADYLVPGHPIQPLARN